MQTMADEPHRPGQVMQSQERVEPMKVAKAEQMRATSRGGGEYTEHPAGEMGDLELSQSPDRTESAYIGDAEAGANKVETKESGAPPKTGSQESEDATAEANLAPGRCG